MIIGIDCGHTLKGADTGAEGQGFKEQDKTREVGSALIGKLSGLGHKVINCTVDSASTIQESLAKRVDIANKNDVELFISIHLNAFNKEARGFEVHISPSGSAKSLEYASAIKAEVCKLGYVDRGVKTTNLYVLNNTKAPAVLLECGFIDNEGDMRLYNAEKIAEAISSGLGLKTPIADSNKNEIITNKNEKQSDNWVARLQDECNKQGFSNQIVDGIQGKNTLNGCPLLREGAQGNITKLLQEKLRIIADGIFGTNTREAVLAFQINNRLIADGIVGKNTWRKLLGL